MPNTYLDPCWRRLVGCFRGEKILIEADLFNSSADSPASPELHQAFFNNVKQIGLDVETIAPIHGPAAPWSDFLRVLGK